MDYKTVGPEQQEYKRISLREIVGYLKKLRDPEELDKIKQYVDRVKNDKEAFENFINKMIDFFLFLGGPKGNKEYFENGKDILENLIPKICSETRFEPTYPDIIAYDSGLFMIRDAALNLLKSSKLTDKIYSKIRAKENEETPSFLKRTLEIADIIPSIAKLWYDRKKVIFIGDRVLGVADIEKLDPLLKRSEESYNNVGIAPTNISRYAESRKIASNDVLFYVICHEYIHSLQSKHTKADSIRMKLIDQSLEAGEHKHLKKDVELIMIPIEGHAEFFTNNIMGKYYEIELPRRRSLINSIKLALYGLSRQMERYNKGEQFIRYLYNKGGIQLAHAPLNNPPISIDEILKPNLYLKRID